MAQIGALLRRRGPVNPIIQDTTAVIMDYYARYGHASEFYKTITSNPALDDKIRQLIDVFGFRIDGYETARRQFAWLKGTSQLGGL